MRNRFGPTELSCPRSCDDNRKRSQSQSGISARLPPRPLPLDPANSPYCRPPAPEKRAPPKVPLANVAVSKDLIVKAKQRRHVSSASDRSHPLHTMDPHTLAPMVEPPRHRRSLTRIIKSSRRTTSLSPCRQADAGEFLVDRDELRCAICFDLLCFPVTLPCGHNFDRGCLLSAWEHEPLVASSTSGGAARHAHACPLCRQRSLAMTTGDDLQVNLLLKKLIAAQFPLEVCAVECAAKHHASSSSSATVARPPSERRHSTWRTATSFFYVWLASVTEPPGFVLAVLLLMSLVAMALTPQQMLTNATTLPTVFEGLDHILNAFLLLIREIATRLDTLDVQTWPFALLL